MSVFGLFKKKREEFRPSRFVKDYLIVKNSFSEIDKMKLMMSNDLVKNLNISISYDTLDDVLKLLDEKYHQELRKDLHELIPLPPKDTPMLHAPQKQSLVESKEVINNDLIKELLAEVIKLREKQNGTIQNNPVTKE